MTQLVRMSLATGAIALSLAACSTTTPTRTAHGPTSDERAFASTFASCREEVRAGKTSGFRISPLSPVATNAQPGETRLALKVPYDKSRMRSKAARYSHDTAFRTNVDRCLSDNGYDTRPFDATRN